MQASELQARYAYARVTFKNGDTEIIVGVEVDRAYDARGDMREVYRRVRESLWPWIMPLLHSRVPVDDALIAECVERRIRAIAPGKSYFIEVGHGENYEWVQVFEPHHHNR